MNDIRHRKNPRLASGVLIKKLSDPSLAKPDVMSSGFFEKSILRSKTVKPPVISSVDNVFPHFTDAPYLLSLPVQPLSDFESTSSSGQSSPTLCLPMLSVTVDATVNGMVGHTVLTQTFHNPSKIDILEAKHTFPLYDGAVVTSFEYKISNKTILRGIVEPKEKAKRKFDMATKEKPEVAALVEELTPEIFETSLGLIPAGETIETKLTYVHELKAVIMEKEKAEGLALIIPTSIAPRYGGPGAHVSLSQLECNRLDIWIRVVDDGTINIEGCHDESGHGTNYKGTENVEKPVVASAAELIDQDGKSHDTMPLTQSVWHWGSQSSVLRKDFVFIIRMLQEHQLRPRVVLAPAIDNNSHAALMLNFRPSDVFGSAVQSRSFTGEIIFLLDCSASMGWSQRGSDGLKVDVMRKAMRLALAGLPITCAINILVFGDEVRGVWTESRPCIEAANREVANRFASQVTANMGGTQIRLALRAAVESRNKKLSSTQIILITDGEVESEPGDPILQFVAKTRQELCDKVRFFTLGIGDRVSHRIVESIAALGGGYCDVVDVVEKPQWEDRLNRILRATMEPDSWVCEADLGPAFEKRSLMSFRLGGDKLEDPAIVPYVQGPCPIPPLHPYGYKSIFFLLDAGSTLPSEVVLKTTTPGTKTKTYRLPVEAASIRASAIHHLATKAVLKSLEDETQGEDMEPDVARANAEYLGVKYSIASKWTSFVAVPQDMPSKDDEIAAGAHEIDVYKTSAKAVNLEQLLKLDDDNDDSDDDDYSDDYNPRSGDRWSSNLTGNRFSYSGRYSMSSGTSYGLTTGWTKPYVSSTARFNSAFRDRRRSKPIRHANYTDMSATSPARTHSGASTDDLISSPLSKPLLSQSSSSSSDRISPSVGDSKGGTNQGGNASNESLSRSSSRFGVRLQCDALKTNDDEKLMERKRLEAESRRDSLMKAAQFVPRGRDDQSTSFGYQYSGGYVSDYHSAASDDSDDEYDTHDEDGGYVPAAEGPLTWDDAVGCQGEENAAFHLPDVVRVRLRLHFCARVFEVVGEKLRRMFPQAPPLAGKKREAHEDSKARETLTEEILFDTLSMIVYFRTHLAAKESSWDLVMSKAEAAVLVELGLEEDAEERLAPVYELLLLSVEHVHFKKAVEETWTGRKNMSLSGQHLRPTAKTCPICEKTFNGEHEMKIGEMAFKCLSDACYVGKGGRKEWDTWDQFWGHQQDSSHMLCPEGDGFEDDADENVVKE